VGRIKKILVSAILAVSAGVVAMITPLTSFVGAWTFFLVAVPVFAMIFASYALQKPKGKQTSYQQPVRIAYVKRAASGKVSALTLAFSHARYGQAFAGANKEEVERGVLGVEEG
jgi:hypothetical protein